MKRIRIIIAIVLAAFLLAGLRETALAHGHTQVGDYELVIGFHNEPAYQGEPNGLDLFVTNTATDERVNGLEETLQVEIIFGSARKELEIEPQFGQDGAYTAHLIPTETGDYTWHIFGSIEGTPVDVSMTSSPDTFSSVASKSALAFPAAEPAPQELQARASAAEASARTALILGAAGALLGLAGLAAGLLGWSAARQARRVETARSAQETV